MFPRKEFVQPVLGQIGKANGNVEPEIAKPRRAHGHQKRGLRLPACLEIFEPLPDEVPARDASKIHGA